jgi:hypothetical protein
MRLLSLVYNKKEKMSKRFSIIKNDNNTNIGMSSMQDIPIIHEFCDGDFMFRYQIQTLVKILRLTKKHKTTVITDGKFRPSNVFYRDFMNIIRGDVFFHFQNNRSLFNFYDIIGFFYQQYHADDEIEIEFDIPFQYYMKNGIQPK